MRLTPRLFAGIYPGGVVYADKEREEHGDYKRIAFLPYDTLELRIDDPASPLLAEAVADAATIQARRGEDFAIDACGHTIALARTGDFARFDTAPSGYPERPVVLLVDGNPYVRHVSASEAWGHARTIIAARNIAAVAADALRDA